jgi:hypothetical protein
MIGKDTGIGGTSHGLLHHKMTEENCGSRQTSWCSANILDLHLGSTFFEADSAMLVQIPNSVVFLNTAR